MQRAKHAWVVGVCILALVAAGVAATEEWSYHGETGPTHWAENFPICDDPEQSPIDISSSEADYGTLASLVFQYDAIVDLQVENNGHTIQANVPPGMAYLTIGEGQELRQYMLLQFHWHTGSEHFLNGIDFPLEMHLVHKAADGTLGVVGFQTIVGAEHEELAKIFDELPPFPEESAARRFPYLPTPADFQRNAASGETGSVVTVEDFDLSVLLPELTRREKLVRAIVESLPPVLAPYIPKPPYLESYRYDGSLTTPPCTQGVKWHVMAYQLQMSEEQIATFRGMFFTNGEGDFPDGNRRPVQPLNGRIVSTDVPHLPFGDTGRSSSHQRSASRSVASKRSAAVAGSSSTPRGRGSKRR